MSKAEKLFEETWINSIAGFTGRKKVALRLQTQFKFHPDRKFKADFYIEYHNLIIELVGIGYGHTTLSAISKDMDREREITKLGYRLLKYPSKSVTDSPQWVVDDVLTIIESWEGN